MVAAAELLVELLAEMVTAVGRGTAQPAVEGRPAHAARITAEGNRADPTDDDLGGGFDTALPDRTVTDFRPVLLVDDADAVPEAVRERAAHPAEDPGLHDRLGVEALPVSLDDLDELREHVFEDFLGCFLGHFGDQFGGVLEEGVLDLLDREPAEAEDFGDKFDGERIGDRPQHVEGGDDHGDDHRILAVLNVQGLVTQSLRLRGRLLREIPFESRELRRELGEVLADCAADVTDDLPCQIVEALARILDPLRDFVPFGGQRTELVLVALRPGVARDDVEEPVKTRIDLKTHRVTPFPASVPWRHLRPPARRPTSSHPPRAPKVLVPRNAL
ncbi:hypothetical protein [Amycolatopsis sp.]|uniref:hypothetical protein n=1 Tax=Amycolatopsis sp. TaxID=37632 RepID=UPI0026055F5D|nr:hypothetical protein [Amycolatopsis sp.]